MGASQWFETKNLVKRRLFFKKISQNSADFDKIKQNLGIFNYLQNLCPATASLPQAMTGRRKSGKNGEIRSRLGAARTQRQDGKSGSEVRRNGLGQVGLGLRWGGLDLLGSSSHLTAARRSLKDDEVGLDQIGLTRRGAQRRSLKNGSLPLPPTSFRSRSAYKK